MNKLFTIRFVLALVAAMCVVSGFWMLTTADRASKPQAPLKETQPPGPSSKDPVRLHPPGLAAPE